MFKVQFVSQSIKLGIDIMGRNQERFVDDKAEELEKTTLSLSILNYFKYISRDSDINMKLVTLGKENTLLRKILHAEQSKTCDFEFVKTPIEIETS